MDRIPSGLKVERGTEWEIREPLRVLAVTNMYPHPKNVSSGAFVSSQIDGIRRSGITVDVCFCDRENRGLLAYRRLAKELREQLAEGYDLVHVMYGGVMADVATRVVRDRPLIVSFCGSDLLGCVEAGLLRYWMGRYGVLASYRAALRADAVIVKSRNLAESLRGRIPDGKVTILPNGVNVKRFRPMDRAACRRELGWREDRHHVVFPANAEDDPVKRPWLAREAVEACRKRGFPTELHPLRGLSHDKVPLWLNAADSILLTSRHEGSPNIVKEALACDVPVVSVDVGDVREWLAEVTGCYVCEATPEALAGGLARVFQGPGRVEGRHAMSGISIERVNARLTELYQKVLQKSCGASLLKRLNR